MYIQYELRHTFKVKLIEYIVFARRLRCSKHLNRKMKYKLF